jgi:hypothetical protein
MSGWVTTRHDKAAALKQAKQCILAGCFVLSRHCRERMEKRKLVVDDILNCIKRANVLAEPKFEAKSGKWSYKVSTKKTSVVYSFGDENGESVVMVTTFWLETGRKL